MESKLVTTVSKCLNGWHQRVWFTTASGFVQTAPEICRYSEASGEQGRYFLKARNFVVSNAVVWNSLPFESCLFTHTTVATFVKLLRLTCDNYFFILRYTNAFLMAVNVSRFLLSITVFGHDAEACMPYSRVEAEAVKTWAEFQQSVVDDAIDQWRNKKVSIRWQDSARRQFQAGLRGDVGL